MLTVIGEALVDEVVSDTAPRRFHPGGSPLNVAVGVARLGRPVQFVGRFGSDTYGAMIAEHLRANSVLTAFEADELPTSVATAVLDPAGGARYTFDLDWTLPGLDLPSLLDGTTMLHTGSIAAMLSPGSSHVLRAVEEARPGCTITYDPNCRPTIITDASYAREQAEKFVALADVVKASDEDLRWLYPDQSAEESARQWLAAGPSLVVVTRGSKGPWAVAAAGEYEVAAPTVSVVDTVGAGDSFMSALLVGLMDRELDGGARRSDLARISSGDVHDLLSFAARAAAVTVSRAGANPPYRSEVP
ncbi:MULTISPECIES: carbohydrate kinase [unclassified Arthrobacter]|uniref:carbohydrate kinase family protein n=1 Tax=unclassified Arthrobacter TaxID=235627 RepID=UPI0024DF6DD0|nr:MULTISPECIES: carbohydrate kinase [unclassified Arthrobacter]MCC9144213.1 carbohydrate kinase [Arthrobacter sp. zg-Y919]MDK1275438.1 carbohydrate kinase [Arthrobacter sp. zg.Y919]WIB03181.1 carbohydrate kinase [Arthrobacter sp. zg-Y919]